MKKFSIALILSACVFGAQSVCAKDYVIAVSPWMEPEAAKAQSVSTLKVITALEPGDSADVLDGYHLSTVTRFTIPDNPAYKSEKAKIGANRKAVGALMRFAKEAKAPGGSGAPSVPAAIRLPALLRYVAETYSGAEAPEVIILGSPFYDDPREPEFSMAGGRFPGDGHLGQSPGKTPFGTAGSGGLPEGFRIHFAYTGNMESERHGFFVKRFWTLFVKKLGGKLVSFTPDLPGVIRKLKNNADAPEAQFKPDATDKLEMIRLRREEVQQSIYERPVTTAPLPSSMIRRAENVEIGLSWDCADCDLDVYARAFPGAQILYFGQTETPEGRYWKDYQNAPAATNGRETITFNAPLDLRALSIGVNFYKGEAPGGVSAELRLAVRGRTYAMPLHIPAAKGNRGGGMEAAMNSGNAKSDHIVMIDPVSIVTPSR